MRWDECLKESSSEREQSKIVVYGMPSILDSRLCALFAIKTQGFGRWLVADRK